MAPEMLRWLPVLAMPLLQVFGLLSPKLARSSRAQPFDQALSSPPPFKRAHFKTVIEDQLSSSFLSLRATVVWAVSRSGATEVRGMKISSMTRPSKLSGRGKFIVRNTVGTTS